HTMIMRLSADRGLCDSSQPPGCVIKYTTTPMAPLMNVATTPHKTLMMTLSCASLCFDNLSLSPVTSFFVSCTSRSILSTVDRMDANCNSFSRAGTYDASCVCKC